MIGAAANMATGVASSNFSPTIYGRIYANGIVAYALDIDFQFDPGPASAANHSAVWVIQTATSCFIRVGRWVNSAGTTWYNTTGASQGDPGAYTGVGTTVFDLGEQCDSVNIYNSGDTQTLGTSTFSNPFGTSYTSDDKTTFFAPTQDSKYGRRVASSAFQSGFGSDIEDGKTRLQVTFRKSGYPDYTIEFEVRARAQADVDL